MSKLTHSALAPIAVLALAAGISLAQVAPPIDKLPPDADNEESKWPGRGERPDRPKLQPPMGPEPGPYQGEENWGELVEHADERREYMEELAFAYPGQHDPNPSEGVYGHVKGEYIERYGQP